LVPGPLERALVVTGTDTGVGKTMFAAALVRALGANLLEADPGGVSKMRADTATVEAS
jgi:predicted kinase